MEQIFSTYWANMFQILEKCVPTQSWKERELGTCNQKKVSFCRISFSSARHNQAEIKKEILKSDWLIDPLIRYAKNKEVMTNLWNQISDIADFDKVNDHFHFLNYWKCLTKWILAFTFSYIEQLYTVNNHFLFLIYWKFWQSKESLSLYQTLQRLW